MGFLYESNVSGWTIHTSICVSTLNIHIQLVLWGKSYRRCPKLHFHVLVADLLLIGTDFYFLLILA